MGITANNPNKTEKFYRDLDKLLKSLKGKDIINLDDFNSKLGFIRVGPVGSFGKGLRNGFGEMLYEILDSHFKQKTSLITTWEGIMNQKRELYFYYVISLMAILIFSHAGLCM